MTAPQLAELAFWGGGLISGASAELALDPGGLRERLPRRSRVRLDARVFTGGLAGLLGGLAAVVARPDGPLLLWTVVANLHLATFVLALLQLALPRGARAGLVLVHLAAVPAFPSHLSQGGPETVASLPWTVAVAWALAAALLLTRREPSTR